MNRLESLANEMIGEVGKTMSAAELYAIGYEPHHQKLRKQFEGKETSFIVYYIPSERCPHLYRCSAVVFEPNIGHK